MTAGLALTGAIAGGVIGGFTLLVWELAADHHFVLSWAASVAGVGALFGAAIGTVLAPVASWLLLRTIPLGRAVAETAAGTVLGALAGAFIAPGPILCGAIGFALAAIRLRVLVAPRLARERGQRDRGLIDHA